MLKFNNFFNHSPGNPLKILNSSCQRALKKALNDIVPSFLLLKQLRLYWKTKTKNNDIGKIEQLGVSDTQTKARRLEYVH
jgi:hypothetical protein